MTHHRQLSFRETLSSFLFFSVLTGISVDLQKYRIYLRRLGGVVSQHQGSLNNSFMTGQDASYGPLSSLNGFDLPAQSLAQLQGAGLARPVMVSKSGLPAD
ncbi:hypothetical protein F2Q70_00037119 [Brassica cretica]|uniref:Uncharacterized protein n=1 Tax=Brassica cretica TaxID=69181 RepID=A0A8S9JNT3_BRACR|nr:hypothetical protein F2Q70_00037119 [Brassica cretica]KAF3534964.1 hypothetical protein DY000_02042705 [Brassica cretica]